MEEKNNKITEVLQKLKGHKVYLVYKHSPESEDFVYEWVVVGEVRGRRCTFFTAINNSIGESNNYIGNIAAITASPVDLYYRDIPENIFYENKEMLDESKMKTR